MPSVDITFNNKTERSQPLEKSVYVIGRQESCDIHIDNLGVSRNHARIIQSETGFCVEDMNSSNGTFVNGEPVKRHDLQEGDEISIGKYVIIYRASGAAPAQAAPADPAAAGGGLPDDALNTMAMDGDAIRKRLEAMHAQKTAEAQGESKPEEEMSKAERASANTSVLGAAEMRARNAERAMHQKSNGKTKIIIVAVMAAALAAVAYYLLAG